MCKLRLSAGKKVGEGMPLGRSLRMEGKIRVVGSNGVFGFEFTDAPGAQVAPRSYEVRKDLQDDRIGHGRKLPTDHVAAARLSVRLMRHPSR